MVGKEITMSAITNCEKIFDEAEDIQNSLKRKPICSCCYQ
jgi:hypothetical protein